MISLNLKQTLVLRFAIGCLVLLCLTNISCSPPAGDQTANSDAQATTEVEQKSQPAVEKKPEEKKKPVPFELEALPDGDGEDGSFSISQVMQLAHDNRLFRQILKDEIDPKCAERLVLLYESLPKQTPPKGDPELWKSRSNELLEGAKNMIEKKAGAKPAFMKAVNCLRCHDTFRDE